MGLGWAVLALGPAIGSPGDPGRVSSAEARRGRLACPASEGVSPARPRPYHLACHLLKMVFAGKLRKLILRPVASVQGARLGSKQQHPLPKSNQAHIGTRVSNPQAQPEGTAAFKRTTGGRKHDQGKKNPQRHKYLFPHTTRPKSETGLVMLASSSRRLPFFF